MFCSETFWEQWEQGNNNLNAQGAEKHFKRVYTVFLNNVWEIPEIAFSGKFMNFGVRPEF